MQKPDYKGLGQRIRDARRQKGLTQEKLGELCGLSTAHVGHVERGSRIPSPEALLSISQVLEVSADWLLTDSVQKPTAALEAIMASLRGKDPAQVQKFLAAVRVLADRIDAL